MQRVTVKRELQNITMLKSGPACRASLEQGLSLSGGRCGLSVPARAPWDLLPSQGVLWTIVAIVHLPFSFCVQPLQQR